MTIDSNLIYAIGSVGMVLVPAGIIAIIKHTTNSTKHPCKKDVVFVDVCREKMKGQEDCVESELRAVNEKVDSLKVDMRTGFKEVKDLIRSNRRKW